MKVLITGINGFVGSHLAELCLKEKDEVFGLVRHRSNLEHLEGIRDKIKLFEGSITDTASVDRVMREVKPDRVFHLAAQSYVPYSWVAPQDTMTVNVIGTTNVLESVRNFAPKARVHIASTSETYGKWDGKSYGGKITEETPLLPLSIYGASKVAADLLGYQYYKAYGLNVIRTRAFNHEGPRRGAEFVSSTFIIQALQAKLSKVKEIKVGNLDAIRDFSDVRDVVKAYKLILENGDPGEVYNICSGKGVVIKDLLGMVLEEVFGKDNDIKIILDPERMRPADVPVLIGDCSKLKKKIKWSNIIGLRQTVKDMRAYWMASMNPRG